MKSAFKDIVSDEMKKIKDNHLMESDFEAPSSSDSLWEYDGLQDAFQGEREEILLEMQRIFYEDLREQPTGKGRVHYLRYELYVVCGVLCQAVLGKSI